MVLTGDSGGHREYMLQFDVLLSRIGEREAFRHKIVNRSIESDLRIFGKLMVQAVIQEQTESDSRRRLGAGPTIKRCGRHRWDAVPLAHEVAMADDHDLPWPSE